MPAPGIPAPEGPVPLPLILPPAVCANATAEKPAQIRAAARTRVAVFMRFSRGLLIDLLDLGPLFLDGLRTQRKQLAALNRGLLPLLAEDEHQKLAHRGVEGLSRLLLEIDVHEPGQRIRAIEHIRQGSAGVGPSLSLAQRRDFGLGTELR